MPGNIFDKESPNLWSNERIPSFPLHIYYMHMLLLVAILKWLHQQNLCLGAPTAASLPGSFLQVGA